MVYLWLKEKYKEVIRKLALLKIQQIKGERNHHFVRLWRSTQYSELCILKSAVKELPEDVHK